MEIKPFIFKEPMPTERDLKYWFGVDNAVVPRPTIPCPWKPGDALFAFNGRRVVCAGIRWSPMMRREKEPDNTPYYWTWWIETHAADAINDYSQIGEGWAFAYDKREDHE